MDTHTVGCKSSDGYEFSVTEIPISQKKNLDLDAIVSRFKKDGKNIVTGVDRSTYASFSTITFEVSGPNGGAFMKDIKANSSLLSIILEYPKGGRDFAVKMKPRFFDSVQWK